MNMLTGDETHLKVCVYEHIAHFHVSALASSMMLDIYRVSLGGPLRLDLDHCLSYRRSDARGVWRGIGSSRGRVELLAIH